MANGMGTIHVQLGSDDKRRRVHALAHALGLSLADFIRAAVDDLVEESLKLGGEKLLREVERIDQEYVWKRRGYALKGETPPPRMRLMDQKG